MQAADEMFNHFCLGLTLEAWFTHFNCTETENTGVVTHVASLSTVLFTLQDI